MDGGFGVCDAVSEGNSFGGAVITRGFLNFYVKCFEKLVCRLRILAAGIRGWFWPVLALGCNRPELLVAAWGEAPQIACRSVRGWAAVGVLLFS